MMLADLPPSSSVTFLMVLAASCCTRRPTSVEPVSATLSTSGLVHSSSPHSAPLPWMTLTTPFGRSVGSMIFASSRAEQGVSVAGFSTSVLPVASAGPIFHTAIMSGKFHGMICPHTPIGSRRKLVERQNSGTWILPSAAASPPSGEVPRLRRAEHHVADGLADGSARVLRLDRGDLLALRLETRRNLVEDLGAIGWPSRPRPVIEAARAA
jgi:hypothetical protein